MATALNELLKATSRSFYLTLRVLPGAIRPQVGLAYLLARTTDTIADTEILPVENRLAALEKLRGRIFGQNSARLDFGELAQRQGNSAEKLLLEKVEDSLAELQKFSETDRKLICAVLEIITGGQELDLRRFSAREDARPAGKEILALKTEAELDDYTFRVAGCVGEFWTKICRAHLFPATKLDEEKFLADGIRFGTGLQLVNILRDLPADLAKGRCYLPAEKLAEQNLSPEDLLNPASEQKLRPLYNRYLDLAEANLAAGWNYTNSIPRGQIRVRLACAWPILIGAETVSRLRVERILAGRRIKISRRDVRRILTGSIWRYPLASAWKRQFPVRVKAVASSGNLA